MGRSRPQIVGGTAASLVAAWRRLSEYDDQLRKHTVNLLFDHRTDHLELRSPYTTADASLQVGQYPVVIPAREYLKRIEYNYG